VWPKGIKEEECEKLEVIVHMLDGSAKTMIPLLTLLRIVSCLEDYKVIL